MAVTTTQPKNILYPGQRFGYLVVLNPDLRLPSSGVRPNGRPRSPERAAVVVCRCGEQFTVLVKNLVRPEGGTKACRECGRLAERPTKDVLWHAHHNIMKRCYQENSVSYRSYGGRGISLHKPWHDPAVFIEEVYAEIGDRPSPDMSIDRIDNDGNYVPGNLRWATPLTQYHNSRLYLLAEKNRQYVLEHYSERADVIAKTLKVSLGTVYKYREELRRRDRALRPTPYRQFFVADLLLAQKALPGGTYRQLAEYIGCSTFTVGRLIREARS